MRRQSRLIRDKVLADIENFQQSVSVEHFVTVARLMINDWPSCTGMDQFKDYFMKQWCSPKRQGWIDHYCDWVPVTNNSLEGTNNSIKEGGTFRQRMGIRQFLSLLIDGFLHDWSTLRDPSNVNFIPFAMIPTISLKEETAACQWTKSDKQIKKVVLSGETYYCVTASSTNQTKLSSKEVETHYTSLKNADWKTFREYLDEVKRIK